MSWGSALQSVGDWIEQSVEDAYNAVSSWFSDEDIESTETQCPAGIDLLRNCPPETDQQRIGVVFSIYPVLFDPNQNPAEEGQFSAVRNWSFDTNYLLADGRQEAIIAIRLVKIDDANATQTATSADHHDDGSLIVELDNNTVGELRYQQQQGSRIQIPLSDLPNGESEDLFFRTSNQIGTGAISGRLDGSGTCYQFVQNVPMPEDSQWKNNIQLGSRDLSSGTDGYDVLKLQWYLRRFGFYSYSTRQVNERGNQSEWIQRGDLATDGDFGNRTGRAVEDFQIISLGSFRNQNRTNVAITFASAASETAGQQVIREVVVWHENGYTVEGHHGIADIYDLTDNLLQDNAKILYGAIVSNKQPLGYLQIQDPIATSIFHYGNSSVVVADAIHSSIRLFLDDDLILRLHDADPDNRLDDQHVYGLFATAVRAVAQELRGEQEADYTGAGNRDIRVHSVYRSWAEQNALYNRGGVTNAQGGQSWHNYGVAADIIFYNANGQPSWSNNYNWNRNGQAGTNHGLTWGGNWANFVDRPHHQWPAAASPNQTVQTTYTNTPGTVLQKLQAVWDLL